MLETVNNFTNIRKVYDLCAALEKTNPKKIIFCALAFQANADVIQVAKHIVMIHGSIFSLLR